MFWVMEGIPYGLSQWMAEVPKCISQCGARATPGLRFILITGRRDALEQVIIALQIAESK